MTKRLLSTQKIVNLASDPASGVSGEIYFNTSTNTFKYHNGTTWTALGGGSGGTSITISDTPPSSPTVGQGWFDNTTGSFYLWDGTYWQQVTVAISEIPDPAGHDGQFLKTDGTITYWYPVEAVNVATDVALSNSWWMGV